SQQPSKDNPTKRGGEARRHVSSESPLPAAETSINVVVVVVPVASPNDLRILCFYYESLDKLSGPEVSIVDNADSEKFECKNSTKCSERIHRTSLLDSAFELLDVTFFNQTEYEPAQDMRKKFSYPSVTGVRRPESEEDIAFMSVLELGQLIKTKQISSEELTGIFLRRLKRYNPVLEAVITYTEELAYKQAKEADDLLAKEYTWVTRGPLHGIPYGLKDIIAVPHYKTTWGSRTFKDQVLNIEAWVYKRLKSAGAVLVAKLVSGSLAYDDIWFGGRTRNPWNIEEYSTGSSAGPAACTSAGMVPFAIGSETAGSITFPAARCGITALRPTFGTVGRTGVMSISESLDKLGPFCRGAADCTVVLDAIRGQDPNDLSSRNTSLDDPFKVDIAKLTVGYLDDAEMERASVQGCQYGSLRTELHCRIRSRYLEFHDGRGYVGSLDEWQRSRQDDDYEAQDQWPVELRRARMIPAVDYVQNEYGYSIFVIRVIVQQAQRARGKLIREVKESFNVDAFVGNATDWERVCMGNLVGMPVIVVPTGFKNISNTRRRTTITTGIYALPEHDHIALALAMAYQSVTDHHKQRPPIDDLGPNDSILDPPTVTIPP
ncbi:hypothetical protein C3L33_00434, partial [Rhododendron williamsianum]